MHGARPANLLEEPPAECNGGFGGGGGVWDEADTVAQEKEAGREVAVFINYLCDGKYCGIV
jgi:hypothetical protein